MLLSSLPTLAKRPCDREGLTQTQVAIGLARCLRQGHISGMIRKLPSGVYRLYSRKKDPRTGKRRNLGTFKTLAAAKRHERAVQFFKRR